MDDIRLEELEKEVFDYIIRALKQDLKRLISGLNSRINILNDWKEQFLKTSRTGYNASDLEAGAERIFHHLFQPMFRFPNSCPIGSDMMYQTEDAIIHIEVKTSLKTNPDYIGKIQLGMNQTSYSTPRFKPNLPSFYDSIKVPTLTYAIQIVHEHMQPKINALNVICIPNGQLFKYYGESILNAGKGGWDKATDIRYSYVKQPYFLLLQKADKKDIFRINILLLDKKLEVKDIVGKNLPLQPYERI